MYTFLRIMQTFLGGMSTFLSKMITFHPKMQTFSWKMRATAPRLQFFRSGNSRPIMDGYFDRDKTFL